MTQTFSSVGSTLDDQMQGYLDHLAIERGAAANTLSSYRRDLRRYTGWLAAQGIQDVGDVREDTVTSFLVALREGDAEHPPLGASSAALPWR